MSRKFIRSTININIWVIIRAANLSKVGHLQRGLVASNTRPKVSLDGSPNSSDSSIIESLLKDL